MSALGDYYEAQAAEKKASIQQVQAQAGLITAQTQELGGNDASTRNLQGAQASAASAQASKTNADAANVSADDASTRALQGAQAATQGAQAGLLNSQGANFGLDAASTRGLQGAQAGQVAAQTQTTDLNNQAIKGLEGFSKGGRVVPEASAIQGKAPKPGPTDTVPAMLTPGEAVLNKGAAEHYGSDVIDHMNKMGLMRMAAQSEVAKATGQPDPHAKQTAAKAKQAASRKAPPVGPGGSKQPAGGAPQRAPGGGAVPGFAKGTGMVLPSYTSGDRAAIAGQVLDPTSYGLGILHGAGIGTTNPKDSSQKSA